MQRLRPGNGDGIQVAAEVGPEGPQGKFAVVAGAETFSDNRGSRGLQTGQQHAGLDLGAGYRSGVIDGPKWTAVDGEWCVAVREREPCSHGFKRLPDPLHGTAGERGVADEREGAILRCQKAGNHAHRGA